LLKQTAQELKEAYPNIEVLPIEYDAANADSTVKAVETAYSKFDRIDHAVNNVGIPGPLAQSISVSTKEFKNLLDINLTSMWIAQREQIKIMLQQEPVQQECVLS
jgi:NAD(P)-dependent dehydrogenase (short-subunit alcohol dehydrogenase family)